MPGKSESKDPDRADKGSPSAPADYPEEAVDNDGNPREIRDKKIGQSELFDPGEDSDTLHSDIDDEEHE